MHTYSINPVDGRKSFGNKATVLDYSEERGLVFLKSYDTIVACHDTVNGIFYRTWNGYSATTQRHIEAFRQLFHLDSLGKAEWEKLPVNKELW